MSSQVIRISSGETIQVRTGTIQGIGPQGPVGPAGAIGQTGPQGPQGVPGPTGAVSQFATEVQAGSQGIPTAAVVSNALGSYTNVAFATVTRDDLNAAKSSTNFQFNPTNNYAGQVWVKIQKQSSTNASGSRSVQVLYKGAVIAEATVPACVLVDTDICVPFMFSCTSSSDVLNIAASHNEGVTLNAIGRMYITATGPGPQGPQGPAGAQGATGATGAQGAVGPAGSVANNTTTYATLGG